MQRGVPVHVASHPLETVLETQALVRQCGQQICNGFDTAICSCVEDLLGVYIHDMVDV